MSKFSQNNTVDEARAKEYLNIFFIKCRANEYIHKKDKKMNIILSFQHYFNRFFFVFAKQHL